MTWSVVASKDNEIQHVAGAFSNYSKVDEAAGIFLEMGLEVKVMDNISIQEVNKLKRKHDEIGRAEEAKAERKRLEEEAERQRMEQAKRLLEEVVRESQQPPRDGNLAFI